MNKNCIKKSLLTIYWLALVSIGFINFFSPVSADETFEDCQANPAFCESIIVPHPEDVFKNEAGSDLPYDPDVYLEPDPNTAPATVFKVATNIIEVIFKVAGLLGMIGAIVAGVMMIIGRGNDEYLSAAKHIITYSFIGMIIIAAAYMLILGISQINLG